ncbi:MAG: hypothetical protein QOE93_1823, partial [Actinomycetota bacterium]|nr:hypothetical protein [Actinomycetota bacterium]
MCRGVSGEEVVGVGGARIAAA